MILVRRAGRGDAASMSAVVVRSIEQLCTLDHHDDPSVIAAWTANKTPAQMAAMLVAPSNRMFVAVRDERIVGVGCVIGSDQVGLNYVDPDHRLAGISRALLRAMESAMRDSASAVGYLESTETALSFYRSAGWEDARAPRKSGLLTSWPMRKDLRTTA